LSDQLCVAHVRKYVADRADSILERAEKEWDGHDEELELGKLGGDLRELKRLLGELPEGAASGSGGCTEDTYGPLRPQEKGGERREPRPLTG
jgi:hypothetical protein